MRPRSRSHSLISGCSRPQRSSADRPASPHRSGPGTARCQGPSSSATPRMTGRESTAEANTMSRQTGPILSTGAGPRGDRRAPAGSRGGPASPR
ncbi:hypothetical protein ACFFX0_08945 [Citricoccus parietis]|uniref:Uncharacterized protein n=1 Tax=Citricoccus parietis TaxID=592307 RepID=A0ABV5FXB6_9MICC